MKTEHNMELMLNKKQLHKVASHNAGSWIDFHASLVDLRIEKGMTQAEVAQILGISQPAVSQFEKVTSIPHVGTVLAYALAIGAKLSFTVEQQR